MADNPRKKARDLIALALRSTSETEARNAAMAACRFIAEHALLEDTAPTPRGHGFGSPFYYTPSPATDDVLNELLRVMEETAFKARAARPPPAPTPAQPTVEPRRKPKRNRDARDIIVTHPTAFCKACGQRILRGKQTTLLHGEYYHPDCYIEATEP